MILFIQNSQQDKIIFMRTDSQFPGIKEGGGVWGGWGYVKEA